MSTNSAGDGPLARLQPDLPPVSREPNGIIARDRADTSYERPLRPRPS